MGERYIQTVYPWERSVSVEWKNEADLIFLRNAPVREIVEMIKCCSLGIQLHAVLELEIHGNRRKCAELARALTANSTMFEVALRAKLDDFKVRYLLEHPLELLPSKPSEFDRNYYLEYLQ